MASDVTFNLVSENAKALLSMRQMAKSLQALERRHAKAASQARLQDKALGKTAATVGKLGKSLLALGGIAGIAGAFSQISAGLDETTAASGRLSREIRPLLSLGDNFNDIEGIRRRVLSASSGLGRGSKEVADAFFALQSGASNLSDTMRQDLFKSASDLAFLQNGDLAGSVNLLVKFYQNYGSEVKSVTSLTEKLFAAADRGALTLDELAKFGPDVAAAAKVMNVSLDELLGTLIVTTQQLGRNEKTFTGVRNIILRMSNAQREGINLTGKFTDKLQQLNRIDPNILKKIVGDEAIAAIAVAAGNAGAIADEVARLSGEAGQLRTKLNAIVRNKKQLAEINLAAAAQTQKNIIAGDASPAVNKFALLKADIASGLADTTSGAFTSSLRGIQSNVFAGGIVLEDLIKHNIPGFNEESFIGNNIRGLQDIGRERRQAAQQFARPEAVRQEFINGIDGLGAVAAPGGVSADQNFKNLDRAAEKLERSAAALERAANRRNINAQRE